MTELDEKPSPVTGNKSVSPALREILGIAAPQRNGVEIREAKREKANQDLLYRSEFLATLISDVAHVQASPSQKLRHTLASSPIPHMVVASTSMDQTVQSARSKRTEQQAGKSFRSHTTPALWTLDTNASMRGRAAFARGSNNSRGETARSGDDPLARYLNAWEGHAECSSDVALHTGTMLSSSLLSQQQEQNRMGRDTPTPNPLDVLKIQPVPGIPRGCLFGDHAEAAEMEVARHADKCCHVARLKDEDMGNTSDLSLRFARHYWSTRTRQEEALSKGLQEPCLEKFRRVDGHDDHTGTHKFCLMERGTVLLRTEGRDPFHCHALVTMEQPVQVFSDGHYFEVQVVSLFRTPGLPDRPKELDKRHRTEGLVIGMTAMPPSEITPHLRSATDVPRTWCVATSGKYYASDVPAEVKKRLVNQERVKQAPIWHQRVGKSEQLRCCWPPPQPSAGTIRRKLDWSVALGEDDTLGMLITPFGGIVVLVNGERQLFLPDAGVPTDGHFYPLVEAYNHIRSIRVVPGAQPPT
jgi:hypothetical protein